MALKARLLVRDGKPETVVLPPADYRRLLEAAEDAEDLRELRGLSRRRRKFLTLDQVLARRH